ncbi:AsmA family protein [Afifella pfennigii]|uniref:AsmA family protein n=1 Tax=Afifella pfennigii TaxID=209897 RepID=UPI00047DA1D2|nr:AsmA family protein [Afifella pfennigii]
MMRRSLIALGVLAVLVGGLVFLASQIVSADDIKRQVGEQISAWTGREVSLQGDAVVALLPTLSVKLKDVQIAGPRGAEEPFVQMEYLKASIRFIPLLIGEVRIEDFIIVGPDIRLIRTEDGTRSWDFDSGAAALQLAFAGDVRLGAFVVRQGRILYDNALTGQKEELTNVNLDLTWNSVRQPIELSGNLEWRGERINLAAAAQEPYRFIRGGETPLNVDVQSVNFNGAFSGTMRNPREPGLVGRMAFNAEDMPRFLTWIENPFAETAPLNAVRIDSNVEFAGRKASFADATINLNTVPGRGAFTVDLTGRPAITGTLAFPRFDASPALAHLVTWDEEDSLLAGRVNHAWLNEFTADLRVSADEVQMKALRVGPVAASLLVGSGKATLTIGEATLYGGRLSGSISLAGDEVPQVEAAWRASGVRAGEVMAALGLPPFSGLTDLSTEISARGERLNNLVETLQGRLSLTASDGRLPYIDLAEATNGEGGTTKPLLSPDASTDFTRLEAELVFRERIGRLERGMVATGAYAAELSGDIGLESRTLALSGTMQPNASDTSDVPLRVVGTLASPAISIAPPPSN